MRVLNTIFNILRFNQRNWKAVVLCVVTATIFWCFNALNKTYTTNISFPLAFEYDQQSFIPVGSMPENVRLNVTGNGWELFKRSTGVKYDPLEIPLEHPGDVKKIVGNGLKFTFTNQLGGLEINHVLSDTIYLDLEPRVGRWLQITTDSLQHNLKNNFALVSDVGVAPDSAYVEGPRRLVENLREPFVLTIPQRNIDNAYAENISIELPHRELMTVAPPVVSVRFDVDEMLTVEDSVRLVLENIPPNVSQVMMAGKVPVVVSVPKRFLGRLRSDSVRAVLNLGGFSGGTRKIVPEVKGLPPYTTTVKVDSVVVNL